MRRLTGGLCFSMLVAALALVLSGMGPARADLVWNAASDFDAGFATGTNPNGAWSYGWSSALTSPLTLYTSTIVYSPWNCDF